jgi:hypothetical protein
VSCRSLLVSPSPDFTCAYYSYPRISTLTRYDFILGQVLSPTIGKLQLDFPLRVAELAEISRVEIGLLFFF